MHGVHPCRKCEALCPSTHPWCLYCRQDLSARVATLARRAEADASPISPLILRHIDSTVARINRREAQAKRRARVSGLAQLWSARILIATAAAFVSIRLVLALGDLIVRAL
jgi:hypothetical protein